MSDEQPSLFFGAHVPQVRFDQALARLDLEFALDNCVGPWDEALSEMIAAGCTKDPAKIDLARLVAARVDGWTEPLETAWQRLVGERLDSRKIPGVHEGQFAADFLRRGGEVKQAAASARRSVAAAPGDGHAWVALAHIDPHPAAARAAFHGIQLQNAHPPLAGLERILDALEEDELPTEGPWLLPYAWLVGLATTEDLASALAAEHILERPIPMSGNATAFAFCLVEVEAFRQGTTGLSGTEVDARRRLKIVSEPAFRRYLARTIR